ncbi:hypothetical protein ACFSVM_12295 [Paenibacillus shunpengii]|uniref:ABC-2 type transport system permease protein n=1 Tax=Paenibacillus shunpengii TaxID=2054424 RepID=A0ABW5SPP3_9BACL
MMEMKPFENSKKIAFDLFYVQMVWTLWYVSFLFVVQFMMLLLPDFIKLNVSEMESPASMYFMNFGLTASKTYMLVIGIISSYAFLKHYIHQGVTRKDYFVGSTIAVILLSILLPILMWILSGVQYLILGWAGIPRQESVVIGYEMFSLMPFIIFTLQFLVYYLAGWMVSMSFYRFGFYGGMLSIPVGLAGLILLDMVWGGGDAVELLSDWLPIYPIDLTTTTAMLTSLVLAAVFILLHRLISRNIVIKIK